MILCADFVHESFNIVLCILHWSAGCSLRAKPLQLPVNSLEMIRAKRLAEQLADVAVLILGDGDDLFRQGLREANGENPRGSALGGFNGSAHATIMTEYDKFVHLISAPNGLQFLLH